MDTHQKDNFTDVAGALADNASSSAASQSAAGDGQVVGPTGEVVNLGQESSHTKGA